MNKHTICGFMMTALSIQALAQSGTNSPYSQYGLGVLSDQSMSFNRGMNGVGIAMRQGNQLNALNPASYSGVDSLTMLFDAGLSVQTTNYKEGSKRVNASNANFDYAVGSFRLLPKVGMAFGFLPYTNVGYEYSTSKYLDATNGSITEMYSGEGGLRQAFVGAGWQPFSFLSVGANVSYVWGGYDRTVLSTGTSNVNSLMRNYQSTVSSYKIDLGMQIYQPIGKKDLLSAGLTVGVGHKLGAEATCDIINVTNSDTIPYAINNALEIPMSYGIGLAWAHGRKWTVGADFKLQKWGAIDFPVFENNNYVLKNGLLKDRYELNVGGEWVPNEMSSNLLHRIHYRMGVGYATPYYNINGKEGPKELSMSAGFGIPLQNRWNSQGGLRSVLNISAQWLRASSSGLVTENTFRINIGLTFNERWFSKWKVD